MDVQTDRQMDQGILGGGGDQWTDRCYNSLFRMHTRTAQTCQEKGEEFCK